LKVIFVCLAVVYEDLLPVMTVGVTINVMQVLTWFS